MTTPQDGVQLNQVKAGNRGKVVSISASGPLLHRLLSMGFTRNSMIEVVKSAPLGDPVQYRLRGSSVLLRGSEASQIWVEII